MTGVIYCYTSPSEKRYIGQTYEELKRRARWKNMKYAYGGGLKIENARKKYGPENFKYEVLEIINAETIDELIKKLNDREIYWIKKFDTFKSGYNSTIGGRATYSEKRSASKVGFKHSEDTKKYLSEINKKRRAEHPYDTACNLQKSHEQNRKSILQYDLDGNFIKEWNCAEEAAASLNIDASSIRKCCRNEKLQASHYIWIDKTNEEILQKITVQISREYIDKLKRREKRCTPVLQYTLDGIFVKEYPSCRIAGQTISTAKSAESTISKCCKGKCKTAYGFKWIYKYDN